MTAPGVGARRRSDEGIVRCVPQLHPPPSAARPAFPAPRRRVESAPSRGGPTFGLRPHQQGGSPAMTRWLIGLLGPLSVLACIAAPVAVAVREQRQYRNFHVVRPGVLYRSGQLTPA